MTPFVLPTLLSPIFKYTDYASGQSPTQFTDAMQRTEFFDVMGHDWHTILQPRLKQGRTMQIPFGKYVFSLNPDGSCCRFVEVDDPTFSNLLFPPTFPVDNTTIIGAAELAGDMTTHDITTLLFPNTYLYENGDPKQCCVLGFHSFDFEPGTPENGNLLRFYVVNYSSWIGPGLFKKGFEDVAALSHEMGETFNDPFVGFDLVHNLTPWWKSDGQCQDLMEVGDVIEGLTSNVTNIIETNGRTYHVQNLALLQWFEFQSPSTALNGAYSFPNELTLTALSAPQNRRCK